MARWAEDDEFNSWVARLLGDGPERNEIPDPDAMTLDMPEIPVAGSGGEGGPELPDEVDGEAEEDKPAERTQAL